MTKQLFHSIGVLFVHNTKMIIKYIKNFLTLISVNLGYDKKLRINNTLLVSGGDNNDNFKYTNLGEENSS